MEMTAAEGQIFVGTRFIFDTQHALGYLVAEPAGARDAVPVITTGIINAFMLTEMRQLVEGETWPCQ